MKIFQQAFLLLTFATLSCHGTLTSSIPGVPDSVLPTAMHSSTKAGSPMTPGPVRLQGVEHLHDYLCSMSFSKDGDVWTFAGEQRYVAVLGGVQEQGYWSTVAEGLWLKNDAGEVRVLPLEWLDGKLRIGIDGIQYMRDWDIVRNKPRD